MTVVYGVTWVGGRKQIEVCCVVAQVCLQILVLEILRCYS